MKTGESIDRPASSRLGSTVAQVMRRHFITAPPGEALPSARQTMRLARLRHLLVTREGRLLGIVSYRALLENLLDGAPEAVHEERTVEALMVAAPEVVTPDTPLQAAADRLSRHRIGCLPVVVERHGEAPRIVGLITETDLLRAAFALDELD